MMNITKLVNFYGLLLIILIQFLSFNCQDNILTLSGHTGSIYSLAALPNGNLVSGSADDTVRVWDTKTGVIKYNITGHSGNVYSVITLLNTSYIASGSGDFSIRIWDQTSGTLIQTLINTRVVGSLAAMPDGTLLSGSYDYSLKVWADGVVWSLSATLSSHTAGINAIAVLKNGFVATASDDQTVIIWNITNSSVVYTLTNHTGAVFCLAVLNDDNLASGSLDNSINIWNPYTGVLLKKLTGHTGSVNALGVLSNGYLASASNDRTVRVWDVNKGSALFTLRNHTKEVNAIAILLNGYIASGSSDLKIKIWNTTNITSPPLNPIISEGSQTRVDIMIFANILLIYIIELFY